MVTERIHSLSDLENAVKILQGNTFCILGTASLAAEPWVTPVAYRLDKQCNVYWTSGRATVHSGNVLANQQMSICVLDQTGVAEVQFPTGSHPRALYASGVGREVPDAEIAELLLYRYPRGNHQASEFDSSSQTALYQFVTSELFYLANPKTSGNSSLDQRIAMDLDAIRRLL